MAFSKQTQNKTNGKMSFLQIQTQNELILNTPNRKEILKAGPTNNQIKNNLLGRGAYGTVIKAIYKAKPVAVKIIKNLQEANSPTTMLNEANILGWKHPNIVRIFKIESTCNFAIVIMERFTGHCLQKVLDTIELPLMHRTYIALDILSGLTYCHNNKLLHLDIKPQNIMVSLEYPKPQQILKSNYYYRSYKCKLCDFGSSLRITEGEAQTKGVAKGTLRYMAPEALKEEYLTAAADIYSFGICLWQLKYRYMPYYWLECNEVVAYQVVKHKLRPNALQSNIEETETSHTHHDLHDNCLCETSSTNLSYQSMENLRNILNKSKCQIVPEKLSIEYPVIKIEDTKRKPLKDLNNNSNSNSVKLNVKRNLQQEFTQIETYSLINIFKQNIQFSECSFKEQIYEEIYKSCWNSDFNQRPKALELFKRFKEFM